MNAKNFIQHIQYYNSLYYKYKYTFPIFAQRVLERKIYFINNTMILYNLL
jgi:hypothetical protein